MSETKSSRASTGNSGPRRRRRNSSNFGKNILPKDDAATGDPPADDQSSSLDDSEPLSLAEEIAEEGGSVPREPSDRYEKIKQGEIHIAELQKMSMSQLSIV